MSRKRKSRAQGQTGPAQNETRENVRYDKYNTGKGRGSSATPIYCGKKVVGHVEGDTFRKAVKSSAHFLRRPRAIAFDVSTLHDAEAAGAQYVEVYDSDTRRSYRLPLATVWAKGWEFDREFGKQWGVPLGEWRKPGEQSAVQPSLFGGTA